MSARRTVSSRAQQESLAALGMTHGPFLPFVISGFRTKDAQDRQRDDEKVEEICGPGFKPARMFPNFNQEAFDAQKT